MNLKVEPAKVARRIIEAAERAGARLRARRRRKTAAIYRRWVWAP